MKNPLGMTYAKHVKPCPFCGAEGGNGGFLYWDLSAADFHQVCCGICGTDGPLGFTKKEARKLWNKGGDGYLRPRAVKE